MTGIQPKPSPKEIQEALQRLSEDTYTQTDVQLLQPVFSSGQSVSALNRSVAIGGNNLGNIFTGDIHLTNLHPKALEPLQPSFRSKKFLYFRGLATYFNIKFAKYIEREHYREYDGESECEGESIDDYWRDLFGPYYAFKKKETTLQENHLIVFKNMVLTEWIPLSPGLFYSDSMWKDHPENIRNLFGDVRFKKHYNKRILSIHTIKDFVAHTDISKGIPIVVDESAYGKVKNKLKKFGSVRIGRIQTTLSAIPKDLRFRLVEGSPYLVPAAEGPFSLINIGKPEPLLGTAWTICIPRMDVSSHSQQKAESVWYKFWVGIEKPNESVKTACSKIKDFVDEKDSVPIYDFDEEVKRFEGATLGPKDFIRHY